MMESEYHTAFLIPSVLDLLLFKKKLTVTGTKGKTQGVSTANKPVTRHIKKIFQIEDSWFTGWLVERAVAITGSIKTEKASSPFIKLFPCFASQVTDPLIKVLSFELMDNC